MDCSLPDSFVHGISQAGILGWVAIFYSRDLPDQLYHWQKLIWKIDELKYKIGIHKTIREYGIDEQDFLNRLDEMVEQAFDDQCTGANPRYPLMSEMKEIYLRAYYGGEG